MPKYLRWRLQFLLYIHYFRRTLPVKKYILFRYVLVCNFPILSLGKFIRFPETNLSQFYIPPLSLFSPSLYQLADLGYQETVNIDELSRLKRVDLFPYQLSANDLK